MKLTLYTGPQGDISIDAKMKNDSMRLSLNQISHLFARDKSTISRHIKNIYKSGELSQEGVVANIATTATDGKTYDVDYYNLDMIISIGYRVDSKQATHFRQRATQTLRQHMTQGYTINTAALTQDSFGDLQKSVALIKRRMESKSLSQDETAGLLKLMTTFIPALAEKNENNAIHNPSIPENTPLTEMNIVVALANLKAQLIAKSEASDSFAQLVEGISFDTILSTVYSEKGLGVQTYATRLLAEIIKQRPYVEGNKRSASFLFVWYLDKNGVLYDTSGNEKISLYMLQALVMLLHEANEEETELLKSLIQELL